MNEFFASGGQSVGVSASASVPPMRGDDTYKSKKETSEESDHTDTFNSDLASRIVRR